jgi:hypothetical protein
MRRLLLLVLVALGCAFVTASPAQACDRPAGPLDQDLEGAPVVFSGTITAVSGNVGQQAGMVSYTVAVDRTWKGGTQVEETMTVNAPATRQACGLRAATKGESWLVLGRPVGTGSVATTSYEGTRLLTDRAARQVTALLGIGTAAGAAPETTEPVLTTLTDDEPAGFWPLALPGAVLALGGLIVVAAARALGRAKGA